MIHNPIDYVFNFVLDYGGFQITEIYNLFC